MEHEAILCVDDDPTILGAMRTVLDKHCHRGRTLELAESAEEALAVAAELSQEGVAISVVICDYIMPGMKGDELLVQMHSQYPDAVKILLTGQSDLQGVKRAINEANLYRFLEKPFNNADLMLTIQAASKAFRQERDLARQNEELKRVNRELERHNSLLELTVVERTRELLEKNQELERLSMTDRLTRLGNRAKLDAALAEEVARCQRYRCDLSLIMLDVDHFKQINDSLGHQTGDLVLADIGRLLKDGVRQTDLVGRWGGEEFIVICRETPLAAAQIVAEKLRQAIGQYDFTVTGPLSASFGVCSYRDGDTAESMVARADKAMYRAKEAGRDRVMLAADDGDGSGKATSG
ncbi:diguanylate cyclase [Chitinimonas sp.]|uniref:GGDEF domain-containing response regulator n=1 Tax=Chitinimonas sp. TaxID=1934313 RepID=UPI0035AEE27D